MGITRKDSIRNRARAACSSVFAIGFLLLAIGMGATPVLARALDLERVVSFSIEPQPIESALLAFSEQSNIQIVISPKVNGSAESQGLTGAMSARVALDRLLKGTGLKFSAAGESVRILQTRGDSVPSAAMLSSETELTNSHQDSTSGSDGSADKTQTPGQASLDEVVVTAQKRRENLLDVPVPVTAISADALVDNNQLRVQDYYATIPGLNVTPAGVGSYQSLTIRGISAGVVANPTVGITIDDVPFGTSTSNGGGGVGQIVPDVDPGDLVRIEVLRGPQGTLYGASSMGGLLKFVTLDPSTDSISGRVEADASGVYHGANLGYGTRASVNLPLSDTFAVRASGFGRQDPGYIDNVETGERGANRAQGAGARLSALWRPSGLFSLKLSALYQKIKGDGEPDVDRPTNGFLGLVNVGHDLGNLQQYHILGSGDYERSVQAYSATLTAKIGSADLTAISGYNIESFSDSFDYSNGFYGAVAQQLFGVAGANGPESDRTDKFTQELRLSVPIGQRFEWLIGGFYTYENSKYNQAILAEDPSSGAVAGATLTDAFAATYMETAGFTNLTIHLTDRFDLQLGGRESQIRQTFSDAFTGPLVMVFFGQTSPYIQPQLDSKANAFTYLVTPQFKVSSDLMIYARMASGYRPGGSNYSAGPGTPDAYNPDKTQDYEIGVKGEFLDHKLSVDASLYYIGWKDIQVFETNPATGIGYIANGNRAKSQGLELSVESRPLTGLTIAAWLTLSDAVLTQAFPPNSNEYGVAGDRLPYSSRVSANLSLERDFPLASRLMGFVRGAVSFVGNRESEFAGTPTGMRANFPSYTQSDFRAGARYDSWTAALTINNISDQRGILNGGVGAASAENFGYVYIQPRTVALTVVKTF